MRAVRYSVTVIASDRSLPVVELARLIEDRGFDGMWLADHTHVPYGRNTAQPREDMDRHRRILDPIVGLAMAAAVTTRISLGTGILLVAQRDPITTAKSIASLDQQSNGRCVVGIGYGWNTDEMEDHGVDPRTRRARAREHVLAMQRLWENEIAGFDGEYYRLAASQAWPKPTQAPLPVLVGAAASSAVFAQIAEFGSGWIPVGGRGISSAVPALREAFVRAGRDPAEVQVVPFSSGDCDGDKVDHLVRSGATEVAFDVPFEEPAQAIAALDRLAAFIQAET